MWVVLSLFTKKNLWLFSFKEFVRNCVLSPGIQLWQQPKWRCVPELHLSVMHKCLPGSCFTWFNSNTFCFLLSRCLPQSSLPWNMGVLDCQKKQLCNVTDQIILRYENIFNFLVGVRVAQCKGRIFTAVSGKTFGPQNTVFAVRELVSPEVLRISVVLQQVTMGTVTYWV